MTNNSFPYWLKPEKILLGMITLIGVSSSVVGLWTFYIQERQPLATTFFVIPAAVPALMAKGAQAGSLGQVLIDNQPNPMTDLARIAISNESRERVDKIELRISTSRFLAATTFKEHEGREIPFEGAGVTFSSATDTLTLTKLPALEKGDKLTVLIWGDIVDFQMFAPVSISCEFGPLKPKRIYFVSGIAKFFSQSMALLSVAITTALVWMAVNYFRSKLRMLK